MRIWHEHHLNIMIPLFNLKRTRTYAIASSLLRPVLLPILLDNLLIEWEKEGSGEFFQEIRCWLRQCHLQCMVINGFNAAKRCALTISYSVYPSNTALKE